MRPVKRVRRFTGPFVRMYRRDAVTTGLRARCEMERETRFETRWRAADMVGGGRGVDRELCRSH